MIAIIFGLAVLTVVVFVTFVIETEKAQFRNNAKMADYISVATPNSKVLVVYFSRSGNTELMAMEIAKHYNAQLVHLEADNYRIGLRGWLNALKDSQTKHASITPEKIDLSQYHTIFIGSPIWWYSPAPPVWQFVRNNNFSEKNVLLFNTFNSQFKQEYIDEFKAIISEKNGHFIKHIYVNRGRMTKQISAKAMLQAVREQLDTL
jgi:flavodoxin